jgi:hypothetical protein
LAEKRNELIIRDLDKIKEWANNLGEDLPGTTGDTNPNSYDYGAPRVISL